MKKIILSTIAIITITTNSYAGAFFNTSEQKVEAVKPESKVEVSTNKDISANDLKQKQILLQLQKELEEKKLIQQQIEDRKKFNKEERVINLKPNQKWVDIVIPFQQMSTIKFDKHIENIETIQNPKNVIHWDKNPNNDENKEIIFKNLDPNLEQMVKVTFVNGQELKLNVIVGDITSKRYTDYKVLLNGNPNEVIAELKNGLKVKNIQETFNNTAVKIIADIVTGARNETMKLIKDNAKTTKLVVFDGITTMETVKGTVNVDTRLTLTKLYKTPYIKTDNSKGQIKSLILLELEVENKMVDKTFVLTPEYVINRFPNYVAFYYGSLDNKDNYISPLSKGKILIVVEDTKYIEEF